MFHLRFSSISSNWFFCFFFCKLILLFFSCVVAYTFFWWDEKPKKNSWSISLFRLIRLQIKPSKTHTDFLQYTEYKNEMLHWHHISRQQKIDTKLDWFTFVLAFFLLYTHNTSIWRKKSQQFFISFIFFEVALTPKEYLCFIYFVLVFRWIFIHFCFQPYFFITLLPFNICLCNAFSFFIVVWFTELT